MKKTMFTFILNCEEKCKIFQTAIEFMKDFMRNILKIFYLAIKYPEMEPIYKV